ncbi:tetratricopeptide repeat protein [Roseibium sp. SCP14]|uniref:tetratricopeptide repeat protein n=1 Tax=Roseibium sp. SCP14 TaxID=3141375 RepID=UPI0033357487
MQSGLPWPKAFANLLPLVQQKLGAEGTICLSRELRGGKSGAQVYVADVHCRSYTGQVILKFDQTRYLTQEDQSESNLLMQAISDAPDFAKQHLPRLLFAVRSGNQFAILSTIAGRGLEYADPWPDVTFERQLSVTRQLARELFTVWNQDYKLSSGMHLPQELLASWLGHRLDPSEGGRIHDFLSDECNLDLSAPSITFEGHWYPNPLAFAEGALELPDRLQIRAVTGRCHGDLHGLNLLVGHANRQDPEYFLIDLADYQSEQFLFFDHAYFEVAYLLTSRSNPDAVYWETILEKLRRRHTLGPSHGLRADDLGLMQIVYTLRNETNGWIEEQERDRLSYMESQYLLARVAAGLSFTHKKIDDRMRRLAFLYAAANLKDYLELNRLDWPKNGPSFSVSPEQVRVKVEPEIETTLAQTRLPAHRARSTVQNRNTPLSLSERQANDRNTLGSFFAELRRRQVIKAAAGYIVVAWLCLQVAIVLQSSLKLPEWTDSLVATLLALGFPMACILAWAYELSPSGLQRTTPASGADTRSSRFAVTSDYLLGIGVLAILLFSVANPIYKRFSPAVTQTPNGSVQKSIAVLPFKNLSASDEKDSFSDGLTIEIISTLARTGKFRVPGQSSSFSYKAKDEDLRVIGKTLGVEYILEGSVRQTQDDFRIEAQLVQADDGFLIWSNVFDEDLQDIFQVQAKIASEIGQALEVPLQLKASDQKKHSAPDPKAYELYVQAIGLYEQRGNGVEEASRLLRESVRIDTDFAAAWAALSLVYNSLPAFTESEDGNPVIPAASFSRAHEFALKAYALDPSQPIVLHAMGNAYRRNRQWMQAEDMYRTALETRPNAHHIMEDYSELLSTLGRHEQAVAMAEFTVKLDPLNALYEYRLLESRWAADAGAQSAEDLIAFFEKDTPLREESARAVIGYLTKTKQSERLTGLIEECDTCDTDWKEQVLALIGSIGEQPAEEIYLTYRDETFVGYVLLDAIGGTDLVLEAYQYFALTANRPTVNYAVPWSVVAEVGRNAKFKHLAEQTGVVDYWRERGWPESCRPLEGDDFECT